MEAWEESETGLGVVSNNREKEVGGLLIDSLDSLDEVSGLLIDSFEEW
jgi:hypothetical protein